MIEFNFDNLPSSSCTLAKKQCQNCHSQFREVRPLIKEAVITRRFVKDFNCIDEARTNVKAVLECSNLDYYEMHKFEENIDGNLIFRAKKDGIHMVYAFDKSMRIIFLRAFTNFSEYGKFLGNRRGILKIITNL